MMKDTDESDPIVLIRVSFINSPFLDLLHISIGLGGYLQAPNRVCILGSPDWFSLQWSLLLPLQCFNYFLITTQLSYPIR